MDRFDVAVIGSGFAGSTLATILARRGMRVALIDRATHPRFAIGESSTPIADMLLRRLGFRYDIGEFVALSTWGGWQESYPELGCGRKRGFTYFAHEPGKPFHESSTGDRSLWAAASLNDHVADTHWYRPDVDHFLHQIALAAGVTDLSGHRVRGIEMDSNATLIRCDGDRLQQLVSDWVVDASGQSGVLSRFAPVRDRTSSLRTETHSTFAHFRGVGSMTDWLQLHGIAACDPFNADDAAQHHLLEDGWMWMLRMNNGITSVGITARRPMPMDWSNYPTLSDLMSGARIVSPPGIVATGRRLQRWVDPVVGPRHIMLPTSAVTLDPLHSTGIAHALVGVERVARLMTEAAASERERWLGEYQDALQKEVRLLDQLISTAYATMHDFPRFTLACMLYFAAAIRCEERFQANEQPSALWNADDETFVESVTWAARQLVQSGLDSQSLESAIAERLAPWNTAGLIDPSVHNRYAYTAAVK
ncbi:MAG: FAD-dependent oxidoreductase [Planctomycetota bacterium]